MASAERLHGRTHRRRPSSCNGLTVPRKTLMTVKARPATTGLTKSSGGVLALGNWRQRPETPDLRAGSGTKRSRSAMFLLQPTRSPYAAASREKVPSAGLKMLSTSDLAKVKTRFTKRGAKCVRSMLPWWTDTSAMTSQDHQSKNAKRTEMIKPLHACGKIEDAFATDTMNSEEQPWDMTRASQSSSRPSIVRPMPGGTPSDHFHAEGRDGVRHINPAAYTYNTYVDCSGLFETPQPSIPTVDQHIRDINLLYDAIAKRGLTEATPVNGPSGLLLPESKSMHVPVKDDIHKHHEEDEADLLFADKDVDEVLAFFDEMGTSDGQVTLEGMIGGFRKIRREWAMLKAEKAGRAVLRKLIRVMKRAGMSVESWFQFMDNSQFGRGDGKLTVLELRMGFQRLAAHIAKTECCCSAYKCERAPTYGLPTPVDVRDCPNDDIPPVSPTAFPSSHESVRALGINDTEEATRRDANAQFPGDHGSGKATIMSNKERSESQFSSLTVVTSDFSAEEGSHERSDDADTLEEKVTEERCRPETKSSVEKGEVSNDVHQEMKGRSTGIDGLRPGEKGAGQDAQSEEIAIGLANTGKPTCCREHALNGMVHLGPRKRTSGLDDPIFTARDIGELMRFIDTDVNFTLNVDEMRHAIARTEDEGCDLHRSPPGRPGELLHVLETHMHATGARFTDLFFNIDRDGNGTIDLNELRALFRRLSREPAKRRARAKAKLELAERREREKAERERTVREAYLRLEVYKKAGVYGVLKRMEVWQVRSGRRIGDAFHRDTGGKAGSNGVDADELAAFMRNIDLDLSPAEAMLVMRHLDSGYDGTVEVQEVVAAVRRIRKDEGIIRAAQRNAGPHWHPERHVSGNGNGGARGWGDNCEAGEYHKGLAPFRATNRHTASHGELLPFGPSIFRPAIDLLTHGRAATAPAQVSTGNIGSRGSQKRGLGNETTRAGGGIKSFGGVRPGGENGLGIQIGVSKTSVQGGQDAANLNGKEEGSERRTKLRIRGRQGAPKAEAGSSSLDDASPTSFTTTLTGGDWHSGSAQRPSTWGAPSGGHWIKGGMARTTDIRGIRGGFDFVPATTSVGKSHGRCGVDASPARANYLACGTHADGGGEGSGWWPEALNAVEDGARVDIYAGSELDRTWLESFDSRLSSTMRATHR